MIGMKAVCTWCIVSGVGRSSSTAVGRAPANDKWARLGDQTTLARLAYGVFNSIEGDEVRDIGTATGSSDAELAPKSETTSARGRKAAPPTVSLAGRERISPAVLLPSLRIGLRSTVACLVGYMRPDTFAAAQTNALVRAIFQLRVVWPGGCGGRNDGRDRGRSGRRRPHARTERHAWRRCLPFPPCSRFPRCTAG